MARDAIEVHDTDIRLGPEGIDLLQPPEMREMLRALLLFLRERSGKIDALETRIVELEAWRAMTIWQRVKATLRRWFRKWPH